MKPRSGHYLIKLILAITFLSGSNTGCATIQSTFQDLFNPQPQNTDPSADILQSEDPIAAAAQRFAPPAPTPEQIQEQQEQIQEAISQHDVTLGMNMDDVVRVWGQPSQVQVAGDNGEGNQKWVYFNGLSAMNSARVIYFEQGKVAGWGANNP